MAIDENEGAAAPAAGALRWIGAQVTRVGRQLTDLVVPPVCLSCQHPLAGHDALCAACWRQVRFIRPPLCDRLGIPLPYDTGGTMVSGAVLANPPDWDRARAVAHFGPVVRELIHAFKYADRHEARRLMGRWLVHCGQDMLPDADVLVPVPLHRWRLLSRKFNQAALLAHEVSRATGVPVDAFALQRRKATASQVGLTEAQRQRNLSGAFSVSNRARVEGRRIVLIDDVITTGSTAGACARVLRRAGAAQVDVLALAMVILDDGSRAIPR
ncbi:MAG: ComF family protein [Hyphomicrobiaceae bacterium]